MSVLSTDRAVVTKEVLKGEVLRALAVRSKNELVRKDSTISRMRDIATIFVGPDGMTPLGYTYQWADFDCTRLTEVSEGVFLS